MGGDGRQRVAAAAGDAGRKLEGRGLRAGRPRDRVFGFPTPGSKEEIWRVGVDSGSVPVKVLATPFNNSSPSLSPDGHWLAYIADESGRSEVYVRAYPGAGGRWQVSLEGGTSRSGPAEETRSSIGTGTP